MLPGSEQAKTLMVSQEMDVVLTMTTVILNVAVAVRETIDNLHVCHENIGTCRVPC